MSEKKTPSPTHLTVPETAKRWGVSTTFVRREIWSGRLRATRFGRAVRVTVEEAERFAASLPEASQSVG